MRRDKISKIQAILAAALSFGLAAFPLWAQAPKHVHETHHLVGEENAADSLLFQDAINDWDPRKLVNPYVEYARMPDGKVTKNLKRGDLSQFIADVAAAEALGKAFFYEMQAGSDFLIVKGKAIGTSCASCHYRFGADARNAYTTRVPFAAWDKYRALFPNSPLPVGETPRTFDPLVLASSKPIEKSKELYDKTAGISVVPKPAGEEDIDGDDEESRNTPLTLIVGSQGGERRIFRGVYKGNKPAERINPAEQDWYSEGEEGGVPPYQIVLPGKLIDEYQIFFMGERSLRQITAVNSPSVINAGFSDRLFHNGRAESTFNGFSIFGDFDRREDEEKIIYVRTRTGAIKPVEVAVSKAALASQAVGPIVNEVEISYEGRTFLDLAWKLVDAQVMAYQEVSDNDSHLRYVLPQGKKANPDPNGLTYRELIKKAFRPEWWDGRSIDGTGNEDSQAVPLNFYGSSSSPEKPKGSLMQANFSLYSGLSIMLYEASLVSNESPFDDMMIGKKDKVDELWKKKVDNKEFGTIFMDRVRTDNPKPGGVSPPVLRSGTEVFQLGFRAFRLHGCFDCHEGPLLSEVYSRDDSGQPKLPIGYTMERTLLPNSKADAIAIELNAAHDLAIDKVIEALKIGFPAILPKAYRPLALELDGLRESARGSSEELAKKVLESLRDFDPMTPESRAKSIAEILMNYEKNAWRYTGNRLFFSENDRVTFVDSIMPPVMLERMFVLPTDPPYRRPLRISGPLALPPYAFYDLGFYNIGASLPQYDRGIGGFTKFFGDSPKASGDMEKPSGDSYGHHLFENQSGYKMRAYSPASYPDETGENQSKRLLTPVDTKFRPRILPKWQTPDAINENGTSLDGFLDRDQLSLENHRRSDFHFFSRARGLVMNEEPWGYRKPIIHDNELAFWGSFKTPSLRNVELTPPYMHNGRILDLFDVLDFYDRGGDVPRDRDSNPDKHPSIRKSNMTRDEKLAIVFFLMCLTDEKVKYERAPFDHPSLSICNGYLNDNGVLVDRIIEIPAVGESGVSGSPPKRFPSGD